MQDLWSVLGYQRVASEIELTLRDPEFIPLIEGPPGVGKTSMAEALGGWWSEAGGSTVKVVGEELQSDIPLYPFRYAMAELASGWRDLAPAIASAAAAGESIVGTRGGLTNTVRQIYKLRRKHRRARQKFLDPAEQEILFRLERYARKRPLLLIADDLHWWDDASLKLLGRLREPAMSEAFPFLQELRVLCVRTHEPDRATASPAAYAALMKPSQVRRFPLRRPRQDEYARILVAFGAPASTDEETLDAVFALTGGNLALAKRCTDRLIAGEGDLFRSAVAGGEFVSRLVSERVEALGDIGARAVQLLQVAAVVGSTFRRDEVACAWTGERDESDELLRFWRERDLVQLDESVGRFVHDVYRQHFLSSTADRVAIHERLDDCLRLIRPSEYLARAQNASHAEMMTMAGSYAIHALLALRRDGHTAELAAPIQAAIRRAGLEVIADRLEEAQSLAAAYRYDECLAALETLPHNLLPSLAAEADFIRAGCLISTRSGANRRRAIALLERWRGSLDEPELSIRLMQLLLYGLAMDQDKAPARELEAEIKHALRARVSFDPSAEDALYILDRCSPEIAPPDSSILRVEEAASHFGPDADGALVRRPTECYRALVNLVAERIVNARFDEAVEAAATLFEFIDSYEEGSFSRLDYAAMNGLLAEFRAGHISASEAVERQQAIIEAHAVAGDPFYAGNALAVYQALAGEFDAALSQLTRLLRLLAQRNEPEPSMKYLLAANQLSVRFVAGDRKGVLEEWAGLAPLVAANPYVIRPFLMKRHALLEDVIRTGAEWTPEEFDRCLVEGGRRELGPQWEQLARGFRLPEIEWWR